MSVVDYLKKQCSDSQVWIIGLGREGISSYSLIRQYLPDQDITLIDDSPLDSLDPRVEEFLENPHTTFLESKDVPPEETSNTVLAIKTPGIPSSHPLLSRLAAANAKITSNTQLFFELLSELPLKPTTIGVTGTKGKSTTTSMIYHVLEKNGKTAFLGGNIGTAPLDLVEPLLSLEETATPLVVLELSSHQLREMTLSPDIAVIQNITPEHLDYYPNFESYQKAKQPITMHQNKNNAVIFCPKFDAVVDILSDSAQRLTFDVHPSNTESLTAYATETDIFYENEEILSVSEVPLAGSHNLYNILPAVIIGKMQGLNNDEIASAIKSFKALPHRLEFVAEIDGVRYFNDSQATTPEAAIAAVASFPDTTIHLIAGGSDKGVDLSEFADVIVREQVASLTLFPPMGDVIEKLVKEKATAYKHALSSLEGTQSITPPVSVAGHSFAQTIEATPKHLPKISHVKTMKAAVTAARKHAQPGDVVLLSPACASFGIFQNYQDRGNQFKAAVTES